MEEHVRKEGLFRHVISEREKEEARRELWIRFKALEPPRARFPTALSFIAMFVSCFHLLAVASGLPLYGQVSGVVAAAVLFICAITCAANAVYLDWLARVIETHKEAISDIRETIIADTRLDDLELRARKLETEMIRLRQELARVLSAI